MDSYFAFSISNVIVSTDFVKNCPKKHIKTESFTIGGWSWLIELLAGYSVALDHGILSTKEYTVVTGAPRHEANGSVIIATSLKTSSLEGKLQVNIILMGEQTGSYFGNSIAVVDLNNDG